MKTAIYGAGQYGAAMYRAFQQQGIAVDFFIDQYTTKEVLYGKPIYRLADAVDAKVYNSVATNEHKVLLALRELNYQCVNFVDSLKACPSIINEFIGEKYLWLSGEGKLLDNKLDTFRALLKDDKSIAILDKIVGFRKNFDLDSYPYPNATLAEQYFCDDIPMLDNLKAIRFVDCGGFIGDTVATLMQKAGHKVEMTISFEPDSNNLEKLNKELTRQSKRYNKARLLTYPSGVYGKNAVLKFSSQGSSSALSESGDQSIAVCSLDETVFNMQPNYIKMDIEGAEKQALLGAEKTIKKYRPNLAVCLYHKPQDLWELPLLIHQFSDNYDMYLRVHNNMGLETVLYCIDKDKIHD